MSEPSELSDSPNKITDYKQPVTLFAINSRPSIRVMCCYLLKSRSVRALIVQPR